MNTLRPLCLCGEKEFGYLTAEALRARRGRELILTQRTLCLCGEKNPEYSPPRRGGRGGGV